MRTHFYPSILARHDSDGHEFVERGPCGTWLGEKSELSGDWGQVDCKRCLKDRPSITASSEAEERAIVHQMGDMAAFMKQQEPRP
jgi:hypothetical protein